MGRGASDLIALGVAIFRVCSRESPVNASKWKRIGTQKTVGVSAEPRNRAAVQSAVPVPVPPSMRHAGGVASAVPQTRLHRLAEYGALGMRLGANALGEAVKRSVRPSQARTGPWLLSSESSVNALVGTLGRMRGAALKLGQMLSIQNDPGNSQNNLVPEELQHLLLRLQNAADFMPVEQMRRVMSHELGDDWKHHFEEFDEEPFAAASIGQVHYGILKESRTPVAVKVQYPGVAESIMNDLRSLRTLLKFSQLLPKGLFLDNTIKVAEKELADEVDYERERKAMVQFRDTLLKNHSDFIVPRVFPELSTKKVLVMAFETGKPLGSLADESQETRNHIAKSLLNLCLREIFEFRTMQTDPNWSNFLYDTNRKKIVLLDFGATRSFSQQFTDMYRDLLIAAADLDKEKAHRLSVELGFLTGHETQAMNEAHLTSLFTLAEPFRYPGVFDFGSQTISTQVRDAIPVMLKYRLKPPPDETYSLHRKLSGAFLLCSKLKSKINCQSVFDEFRK